MNVDEAPETARRFDAQSIPTMLVLEGGEVRGRQVGAAPEGALREWLDRTLASTPSP